MAFRFNLASSGTIAAFAEYHRVKVRLGMSLGQLVMSRMFQKFLYNLREHRQALRDNG